METKVYNISNVSVVFGGVILDSGFGEDTVFTFTPVGPMYEDVKGADGEVCRYATNERRFDLKVSLGQSGVKNAELSAMILLGLQGSNGDDVASLMIKDNNGTTLIAAGKAWLTGLPEVALGMKPMPREWNLRGVWDLAVVGGN